MGMVAEYAAARHAEVTARLRRVLALRAMAAAGKGQRQIARELGVTQPAVSQQFKHAPELGKLPPDVLLEAAVPVLKALALDQGYSRLAVFGSVARAEAQPSSDIDLLVEVPQGTGAFAFLRFKRLIEQVLGREVDLVSYAGLTAGLDDDILHEAVLL